MVEGRVRRHVGMENFFAKYKHIHFIGIGGIGVSAIARMFKGQGKEITGSDMYSSEIVSDLVKEGMQISIGHDRHNVPENTDLVIHTIAIPEINPELAYAREVGIKTMTYPEVLGELSKTMHTIAVSGTHGKTTTTAMLGHILEKAGKKPTVIVGSKLLGKDTNFVIGDGTYLVVEACEYKRSFLNLYPTTLIITNIEADHLDYYKDLSDIQDAFKTIARRVPEGGAVVCDREDPHVAPVLEDTEAKIIDYKKHSGDIDLSVPGYHNMQNALAAATVAESLGISSSIVREALKDFKGTWRRLEYKGNILGAIPLYDDYAHHPSAIKAGIAAIRESYPEHNLICVFEPHQQHRVRDFKEEFALALSRADTVFIAPIYRAREEKDETLGDDLLSHMIRGAQAVSSPADLIEHLKRFSGTQSVVLLMGAGHIHEWAIEILAELG